jgi:hypothetical protein
MKLSAAIKSLLNKFADTQIALRLPGLPLEKSNPNLGDALDALADYEATTPGDWAGTPPKTVGEALDRLAAATPGA